MGGRRPDIDLGAGNLLWFMGWHPDRELNPHYAHLPDVERFGFMWEHEDARKPGERCLGSGHFDGEVQRQLVSEKTRWAVSSWEPLTMMPSLLCGACGAHGFITAGKWVGA
jgi:hypothetical protein